MWEISLWEQTVSVLWAILVGSALSFIYDIFRVFRKKIKYKTVVIFFQDLAFWVIGTFITFLLLIARCNGDVRGYILIGELVGFIIYRFTVSRIIIPCSLFLFDFSRKIYNTYRRLIISFAQLLNKIFKQIQNLMLKTLKKLQNKRKNS